MLQPVLDGFRQRSRNDRWCGLVIGCRGLAATTSFPRRCGLRGLISCPLPRPSGAVEASPAAYSAPCAAGSASSPCSPDSPGTTTPDGAPPAARAGRAPAPRGGRTPGDPGPGLVAAGLIPTSRAEPVPPSRVRRIVIAVLALLVVAALVVPRLPGVLPSTDRPIAAGSASTGSGPSSRAADDRSTRRARATPPARPSSPSCSRPSPRSTPA